MRLTRRNFILGGAASALIGASAVSATSNFTTALPSIEQIPISLSNLPAEFDGYKIGFITDLHIGTDIPTEWIIESIKTLEAQKIDLLMLGGDYVTIHDEPISQFLEQHRNKKVLNRSGNVDIERLFGEHRYAINDLSAPDGAVAVVGNHDLWVSESRTIASFTDTPVRLLINQLHEIRRGEASLSICGTDDYWNGKPRFEWGFGPRTDLKQVRILLTHNPDFASIAMDNTEADFDLALCGHTHAGQIKLPLLGALVHNIKDLRLFEGLYSSSNRKSVYTSRGLGVVGLPFRMNCPPEVTILQLTKS